jgi:CheY-like chemotaxis protein
MSVLCMHFPDAAVVVAHGGPAALELASKQRPDVAVLDLEMPVVDGEKVALALRKAFVDAPPLLLALSGNVAMLAPAET